MKTPGVVRTDTAQALRDHGLRDQIHPDDAVAFIYPSREVFEASAKRDREIHGNDVHGPFETEAGLVGIVDMRPQFRGTGVTATDPGLPDIITEWRRGIGDRCTRCGSSSAFWKPQHRQAI
jgi:hypothetical protein